LVEVEIPLVLEVEDDGGLHELYEIEVEGVSNGVASWTGVVPSKGGQKIEGEVRRDVGEEGGEESDKDVLVEGH
jgi:hypothetical protein